MTNDVMKTTLHAIADPKSVSLSIMKHGSPTVGAAMRIFKSECLRRGKRLGNSPKITANRRIPETIASCDG